MTDETPCHCQKDIARLRDQIVSFERLVDEKFGSRDKAVNTALTAMENRLGGMNEMRQMINDQAGTYLRTATYNAAHDGLVRDVSQIRDAMASKAEIGSLTGRLGAVELAMANWNGRLVTASVVFTLAGGLLVFVLSHVFNVR